MKAAAIDFILSDKVRDLGRRWYAFRRSGRRKVQYFHQTDDPYSHLLIQILPAFAENYDVDIVPLVVPRPDDALTPEPQMLAGHALDDAIQLSQRSSSALA